MLAYSREFMLFGDWIITIYISLFPIHRVYLRNMRARAMRSWLPLLKLIQAKQCKQCWNHSWVKSTRGKNRGSVKNQDRDKRVEYAEYSQSSYPDLYFQSKKNNVVVSYS